jgi:hypothetical protein
VGAAGRFADSVRPKVTALAELGPLLVYVTVPDTGWPALTLAGKVTVLARSAAGTPPMVAVAVLFAGFGSRSWRCRSRDGGSARGRLRVAHGDRADAAPEASVVGMPVKVTTPVLAV